MMKLVCEHLNGVKVFSPFVFKDERGAFVKPFHENQLRNIGISFELKEEFYSISKKDVLRGMHFQVPPHAHQKLVYCSTGLVEDVILDLRKESPSFGKSVQLELSSENNHVVFIPKGFAHGFLSRTNDSCLIYKTDAVYSPEHDLGIHWDSFGHKWTQPDDDYLVSERDSKHINFKSFNTPF